MVDRRLSFFTQVDGKPRGEIRCMQGHFVGTTQKVSWNEGDGRYSPIDGVLNGLDIVKRAGRTR